MLDSYCLLAAYKISYARASFYKLLIIMFFPQLVLKKVQD